LWGLFDHGMLDRDLCRPNSQNAKEPGTPVEVTFGLIRCESFV
jgi:hypothetical protein